MGPNTPAGHVREQIIGEGRQSKIFAEFAKTTYEKLVQLKQEKDREREQK